MSEYTLGDILNEAINPDFKWKREVIDLCFKSKKIEAIKLLRQHTELGLKESKEYVDKICDFIGIKTETVFILQSWDFNRATFKKEFKSMEDLFDFAWVNGWSKENAKIVVEKRVVK